MLIPNIASVLAWIGLLAILVLSLVPGSTRPCTPLPGRAEHFIAYAGDGFLFSLAYQSLRERLAIWISLAILSGAIEIAQAKIPGRSPSLLDAIASTIGLSTGMFFGAVIASALFSL